MAKTMPRILYSPLSNRYFIVTRYTEKETHIIAHTKYDCTEQIDAITASLVEQRHDLLSACEMALEFITNGRKFGYISMPDEDDPALQVPDLLRVAIAKAKSVTSTRV